MIPLVTSLIEAGLGIIGQAVLSKGKEVVESKLNVDLDSMLSTSEGKLALLKIQTEHEQTLKELALKEVQQRIDIIKLDHDNTNSARQMQIAAYAQTDVFTKRFALHFASFWSGFSVLYIVLITFMNIPKDNIRFVDTILGFILGTIIATIINYFYGSSRQSHAKDEALADAIKSVKS